jgi:hypothetical protein
VFLVGKLEIFFSHSQFLQEYKQSDYEVSHHLSLVLRSKNTWSLHSMPYIHTDVWYKGISITSILWPYMWKITMIQKHERSVSEISHSIKKYWNRLYCSSVMNLAVYIWISVMFYRYETFIKSVLWF